LKDFGNVLKDKLNGITRGQVFENYFLLFGPGSISRNSFLMPI